MRDNALVKALRAAGHEALLLPLYLPLQLDEETGGVDQDAPIFFGGINIYFQEKYKIFRKVPRWFKRFLNRATLLRAVAKRSHLTSAREQGEMTLKMLHLDESHLEKETEQLCSWLSGEDKVDVVVLSNGLLAGLVPVLKKRLGVKVVCTWQGEDSFLDGLPEPWKERCWEGMGRRLQEVDLVISPSRFYSDYMEERCGISSVVVPNGIDFTGYELSKRKEKRVGYLARLCENKGLGLLIDAFIEMNDHRVSLAVAGTMTGHDEQYVAALKAKLLDAGLADRVTWHPNLSREDKTQFLASLSVFSVPAIYPEAFGLYLVEAMACGVPVVMPRASAFEEIVEKSEGGLLVEANNARALAEGLCESLNRETWESETVRASVREEYDISVMAARFAHQLERL
jgi:glycosyltransferase involved in cell wall biosynthesis